MDNIDKTITITFGDVSVHTYETKKMGKLHDEGVTLEDMERILEMFPEESELYDLSDLLKDTNYSVEGAYILVIRNPFPELADELAPILFADEEKGSSEGFLSGVCWDRKKKHRGKVANSHARYGLCFSSIMSDDEFKMEPEEDYSMGTTYNLHAIPPLHQLQIHLYNMGLGVLQAEGNYYYDHKKTYIRFHRDRERKKVIGFRLGASFPIHFRWMYNTTVISDITTFDLNHGDIYFMSEKACGFSKIEPSKIYLKHAAGNCDLTFS